MLSIISLTIIFILLYWSRIVIYWKRGRGIPIQLPLFITIMFIPKVNLLKVALLTTAGIRIDDFLILLLLIISWGASSYRNKYVRRGFRLLVLLSITSLFSVVCGILNGYDNLLSYSLFAILRRIEYFSLIISGVFIAKHTPNFDRVFYKEFTYLNVGLFIIAGLQVLGLCGYVVSGSYAGSYFGTSAVATFNGYYEYGQFLCLSIAFYLCHYLSNRNRKSMTMFIIAVVFLFLTNSRTSQITFLVLLFIVLYIPVKRRSNTALTIIWCCVSGVVLVGVMLYFVGALNINNIGRFSTISLVDSWKNLISNLKNRDFMSYVQLFRSGTRVTQVMESTGDVSTSIRFYKWGAAFNGFIQNPILGYGAGVTHAMDGNYIKLLAESGIIGLYLWIRIWFLYQQKLRQYKSINVYIEATYFMMISVLISALFIDMFEASKIMEQVWIFIGICVYKIDLYEKSILM